MKNGSDNSLTTLPELSGERMSQEIPLSFLQGLAGATRLSLKSQQRTQDVKRILPRAASVALGSTGAVPIHPYTGAPKRQHPHGSIPMG